MSLKRQHSKKGNFVSTKAGMSERDFGYSKQSCFKRCCGWIGYTLYSIANS